MITWRARTHKPCEAILLPAYMTDRAKSGTRRSPGVYLPGDQVVEVSSKGWRCNAGREGTPMLTVVPDGCPEHAGAKDGSPSLIDEIVREGARRMLAEALRAEADAYIAAFAAERDDTGRPLVFPNRHHQTPHALTNAAPLRVN